MTLRPWEQDGGSLEAECPLYTQEDWGLFLQTQWSYLLMSQHFSRTSPPQNVVEHSTFTCYPAAILVPKLHLYPGLVRGLSMFAPGPASSCVFESLLCDGLLASAHVLHSHWGLGQIVTDSVCAVHLRKLPRQAFQMLSSKLCCALLFQLSWCGHLKAVIMLWKPWALWLNILRTGCTPLCLCSAMPFHWQ